MERFLTDETLESNGIFIPDGSKLIMTQTNAGDIFINTAYTLLKNREHPRIGIFCDSYSSDIKDINIIMFSGDRQKSNLLSMPFRERKDLEGYIKQTVKESRIEIFQDDANTLIFNLRDTEEMRLLASIITTLNKKMSEIFKTNGELNLTDEEKKLLKSTNKPDEFETILAELNSSEIEEFKFKQYKEVIKSLVSGNKNSMISSIESETARVLDKIKYFTEQLMQFQMIYKEKSATLFGLKFSENDSSTDEEDLTSFLKSNKHITLSKGCVGSIVVVSIKDTARLSEPQRLYDAYTSRYGKDKMSTILGNMASGSQKFRFSVTSCFHIDTGCNKFSLSPYRCDDTEIINPHHDYYGCIGGNNETISSAIAAGDWIQVLSCMQQCARNINTRDGAVMEKFIIDLHNIKKSKRIFVDKEGNHFNADEAYEILNK